MSGNILAYTRIPKDEYTLSLAGSVHFAYREPSGEFKPLNLNYGMLFAEAAISDENTIIEKGLRDPYIYRMKDGSFGITAVRTEKDGTDDEQCCGYVLLWTSKNLIDFTFTGLVKADEVEYLQPSDNTPDEAAVSSLGMSAGSVIQVDEETALAAYKYWTPPHHVETVLTDTVSISSLDELESIRATAVYSDVSTAQKQIEWDLVGIDFSRPGTFDIKGKLVTPAFDFPLARGYADPMILPLDGKYYFIATNDNKNDIGLYVREADTVEALFAEGYEEVLILDVDEEKGFIQTFWAPEFHHIGGELYILFAVGGKSWGPQCHSMKLKKGGCITSPDDWETPLRVRRRDGTYLTQDGITLDMTYFSADGKSFVVWSYRYGIGTPADTGSMLYIAEIEVNDPTRLTSDPVLLTRPVLGWENLQGTINNEGPYPLITDDMVYIAYSGGAARGYTYSIGLMSIPRGSDYLDITKWKKALTPAVNYLSLDGIYGAGHNSFYKDFDGNIMIAYHAEEEIIGHGLASSAIHRVHFKKDGSPVFNMTAQRDLDEKLSEVEIRVILCLSPA